MKSKFTRMPHSGRIKTIVAVGIALGLSATTFAQTGNVGVGTITPVSKLHVVPSGGSPIGITNEAFVSPSNYFSAIDIKKSASNTAGTNAALANGDLIGGTRYFANNGSGYNGNPNASIIALAYGAQSTSNGGGGLAFSTSVTSGAYQEAMRISDQGNVGLGTTAPITKLHTSGANAVGITSDAYDANGSDFSAIDMRKSASNTLGTNAAVADGNYIGGIRTFANTGSGFQNASYPNTAVVGIAAGNQTASNNGGHLGFFTATQGTVGFAIEKMRLTAAGNLGIGTTTPRTMLEVFGTDGIIVPSGTTAQRPATPVFGTIRYNSTIGRGEMYVNDLNGDGTQGDAGWRAL